MSEVDHEPSPLNLIPGNGDSPPAEPTVPDIGPLPEDDPDPPAAHTDGVLIVKVTNENGDISTDVVPLGDVRLTEVQTLLELGRAKWRAKIGLDA